MMPAQSSQPAQPSQPRQPPAPVFPAIQLRLPVAFFAAAELPRRCLFSGRTKQVQVQPLAVDYVPWPVRLTALLLVLTLVGVLLAAIVYSLGHQTVTIAVPLARGQRFKRSLLRALPLPALIVPIAAGGLIGGHFDEGANQLFAWGFGLGTAVGVLTALFTLSWVRARTIGLRALNAGTIEVRFPGRQHAAAELWRAAFERFQAHNRDSDPAAGVAGRLGHDRDAWADTAAESGWDASKSAADPGPAKES